MRPRAWRRGPAVAWLCAGLWLWAAVLPASAASVVPGAKATSLDYVVAIDPATGVAEVDLTVQNPPMPARLCADMRGAGRGVVKLEETTANGLRAVAADPDEADCFVLAAPSARPVRVHYRTDLRLLASGRGDPDYAAHFGPDYVFSDEALLLRPDPLPVASPITVEFRLPAGVSVAPPWRRLPGSALRYETDTTQFDAGSYIALGRLRDLGDFPVKDGRVHVTLLDQPRVATDGELLKWVKTAIGAVADFYGTLPGGQVYVILAPIQGSGDSGLFGTVFRRATPSVTLLFGADAKGPSFDGEWVAFHEFFHIGNPRTKGRLPWFIEGFTTYYTDVLRARTGARPCDVMCREFVDEFQRHCQPRKGVSLDEASRRIGELHDYDRVYWGGACLAFRADTQIRRRYANKRSLDDVLREMRASGRTWDEAAIVATIDRAAGGHIVRDHLRSKKPFPLDPIHARLGVEPVGDTVRFRDDAPDAAIRKAIMGQR